MAAMARLMPLRGLMGLGLGLGTAALTGSVLGIQEASCAQSSQVYQGELPPDTYFKLREDGSIDRLARWEASWEAGRTRFHKEEPNPTLVEFLPELLPHHDGQARVLVPLCGKTLDLAWLASQANVREVYGTEGVQTAMEDLRQAPSDIGEAIRYDHGPLLPESASTANINDRHMENSDRALYSLRRRLQPGAGISNATDQFFARFALWTLQIKEKMIVIFEGDHFDLENIGELDHMIDAVWDRGAMVAIPPHSRTEYVATLRKTVKPGGRVLLSAFGYDQTKANGPPFSITEEEARAAFPSEHWDVKTLAKRPYDMSDNPKFKACGSEFYEMVYLITAL